MPPQHLVIQFWSRAEDQLRTRHGFDADRARADVAGYVARMESHGALEWVYHGDPSEVADAVAGGRFRQSIPTAAATGA